jgi:hypothetical protein
VPPARQRHTRPVRLPVMPTTPSDPQAASRATAALMSDLQRDTRTTSCA